MCVSLYSFLFMDAQTREKKGKQGSNQYNAARDNNKSIKAHWRASLVG